MFCITSEFEINTQEILDYTQYTQPVFYDTQLKYYASNYFSIIYSKLHIQLRNGIKIYTIQLRNGKGAV